MHNKIKIIFGLPQTIVSSVPTSEKEWQDCYKSIDPKLSHFIRNENPKIYDIKNKDCVLCLDESKNYCFFYHFKHKQTFVVHYSFLKDLI